MSTATSNLQLAKDMYASFARGDVPAVVAGCDPALAWSEAEGNPYQLDGAAWHGPQSVVDKLFVRIPQDWATFFVNIESLHEADDHVVMEGRYTGSYKSTGAPLDAQVCHVLQFRDGKLIRFQQYVDTAQLQRVMR
jgi:ketosteroid isomerase-like protein